MDRRTDRWTDGCWLVLCPHVPLSAGTMRPEWLHITCWGVNPSEDRPELAVSTPRLVQTVPMRHILKAPVKPQTNAMGWLSGNVLRLHSQWGAMKGHESIAMGRKANHGRESPRKCNHQVGGQFSEGLSRSVWKPQKSVRWMNKIC